MRRTLGPGLALLSLACSGCPARPTALQNVPRLVDVKVIDRTVGEEKAAVDTAAIAKQAEVDFGATHALAIAIGAPPVPGVDFRLAMEVRLETDTSGGHAVLRAFVESRLWRIEGPVGESAVESRAVAESPAPLSAGIASAALREAQRKHLERAVEDVVKGLGARVRVRTGSREDLVAALAAADPELRAEAIRVAGERKETGAVPALLLLLKGEDAAVRDEAIGALVAIGDRRAVKPLTEVARFGDVNELPKVIDALAALGGDEARAWLEFVASGHDQKEMREFAEEGLLRMDRRASAALPAGKVVR